MAHNTSTTDAKAAAESLIPKFEYERLLNQGKSSRAILLHPYFIYTDID